MTRRRERQQGMAFPLALVAVLIISVLLGGTLLLTVSHLNLTQANSSYANAMNLAEAGVNWELWKISHSPSQADQTPVAVELPPGSGRTFEVHIEAYPSGGAWTPPDPFWVVATGTVDRASRTVRILASGHGLSGLYALFGIDTLNIGGNATVNGAMGSNGYVDINGSPLLNGNFWYCGSATGDEEAVSALATGEVYHSPLAEHFPTVNELANERALEKYGVTTALGVDFFQTTNDNNLITDINGDPISIINYRLNQGTFQQAAKDTNPYLEDGITPNPLYGKNVVVLGPGDYYLETCDVVGNNGIKIDTDAGIVNIWLGPAGGGASTQADLIDGSCLFFTSHDVTHFHLYQGSRRSVRLTGTMDFYGSVYAYNGPDDTGSYYGSIQLLGDGIISGSVIGYDVDKTTGNAIITFPSSGGTGSGGPSGPAPGEPVIFYGFSSSWEEVNPL